MTAAHLRALAAAAPGDPDVTALIGSLLVESPDFGVGVREGGTVQIPKIFPDGGGWRAVVPGIVPGRLVNTRYSASTASMSWWPEVLAQS